MAEVKLYIYKGDQKGEPVTQRGTGSFFFDKSTVLPSVKDDVTGTLKTTTITNTYHISLPSLAKLTYHKKVYEPCEIFAYIQLGSVQKRTTKTTKTIVFDKDGKEISSEEKKEVGEFVEFDNEITNNFRGTASSVNNIIKNFLGAKVILEIDGNTVAENYLVFKVRTTYKTISESTSRFLELTIYSADKMMDLDKYSRAYTARKLYTDILAGESKKFNLKDAEKDEKCTSLSELIANHMQLLKYQNSSSKATNRDELRIPYLVQYNESFYNFMVRCANRFGEFLYFEDGKLNLGMQPSETNFYRRDSSGTIVQKDNANDIIDWATEPNAVQSRYYESVISEGISVEERDYSYTKHTPKYKDAYASSDGRYNPDPTSAGEWSDQDLEKNKYIEYDEALEEDVRCYGFELLFKCLESSTIAEAATELTLGVSKWLLDVHKNNKDYNNVLDEANYQDEDKNYLIQEDQKSGDSYKQFVTYKGSSNLSSNLSKMFDEGGINNFTDLFYQFIRKKEKEVGEQAVWLDFGNYYRPIKLGDKLRVANKDYVAISVEGSYENGQEHLLVSAIPVFSISETEPSPQEATTDGDPWTASVPFPPALPDVVIRDARPQVAFVAENLDPETLGRIRVRYPWQDAKGDMSPWIRVTLPLATTGGAVNFTPSVGDEVMVGYVHGNIEHPYGMGYLTAPFVNERWKNAIPLDQYGGLHGIKVKTGHHLTFADGANAASFVASMLGGPASFVKSFWPTGLAGAFPLGDEISSDFGGGFELADRYGFYKITGSSDDRNISIQSPLGTVNLNAFQGISIEAPNGDIEIKGKNVSIEAGNRLSIKSGENIENKLWYKDGWKGVVKTELLSGLGTLWSHKVENWLDISFLRCLFEWFFIPVNGTLSIKSSTFVTIEAGEGHTEVPEASLRYGKGMKEQNDRLENITKVYHSTRLIAPHVTKLVNAIQDSYQVLRKSTNDFSKFTCVGGHNANELIIKYSDIIKKGEEKYKYDNDNSFTWDGTPLALLEDNEHNKTANAKIKSMRKGIVDTANNIRVAAKDLKDAANKLTSFSGNNIDVTMIKMPSDVKAADLEKDKVAAKIKALTIPTDKGVITLDSMKNQDYTVGNFTTEVSPTIWANIRSAMTRYAIFKYLSEESSLVQEKSKITSVDDAYDNKKWKNYAESVEHSSKLDSIDSFGKDEVMEILNPLPHLVDDQLQWSHGIAGKILMSDQSDKTVFFDNDLNLKNNTNITPYEQNIKDLRKLLKKI